MIRSLYILDLARLVEIAGGYTSLQRYAVTREEAAGRVTFTLALEDLAEPYVKRWEFDDVTLEQYQRLIAQGMSFGAYEGDLLIGIAIAEPHAWNRSLQLWELHVHPDYRGRGIGRQLVEQAASAAAHAGLRRIVCETQNTNVPAIRFYRRMGFELEGIDLSLYPDEIQEVALFMKRRL